MFPGQDSAQGGLRIGRFVCEDLLSADGALATFRARLHDRRALERPFVLRLLRPDPARPASVTAGLMNAARAAAGIGDPGIGRTFDVEEGPPAHVCREWVDGIDFGRFGAGLPPPADGALVAQLGAEIALALAAAHALGVTHGHLVPGNVIVTLGGRARLVDFGLWAALGGDVPTPQDDLAALGRLIGGVLGDEGRSGPLGDVVRRLIVGQIPSAFAAAEELSGSRERRKRLATALSGIKPRRGTPVVGVPIVRAPIAGAPPAEEPPMEVVVEEIPEVPPDAFAEPEPSFAGSFPTEHHALPSSSEAASFDDSFFEAPPSVAAARAAVPAESSEAAEPAVEAPSAEVPRFAQPVDGALPLSLPPKPTVLNPTAGGVAVRSRIPLVRGSLIAVAVLTVIGAGVYFIFPQARTFALARWDSLRGKPVVISPQSAPPRRVATAPTAPASPAPEPPKPTEERAAPFPVDEEGRVRPAPGQLYVETTPDGASVWVDGKLAGKTPADIKTEPGTHRIIVTRTGFQSFHEAVDTLTGAVLRRKLAPARLPPAGEAGVKIRCADEGMPIWVDGEDTGLVCPTERIDLTEGEHRISILDPAKWEIVTQKVPVAASRNSQRVYLNR